MQEKELLMIPGPTPVPESVLQAIGKHPIGHRSPEFSSIFMNATTMLQELAQTKNDVFIYTASGTGAMERHLAFGHNARPGVMPANAGRAYLNRYGILPGQYIVVATNVIPSRFTRPIRLSISLRLISNLRIRVGFATT